jgi:hypothetical protein
MTSMANSGDNVQIGMQQFEMAAQPQQQKPRAPSFKQQHPSSSFSNME